MMTKLENVARLVGVALAIIFTATAAMAVEPDEMLADRQLEARARALSAELRCVVCQNQSIDDSDAPLAKDLRRLVRDRLKAGDTDAEVKDYIVARYGTFVLLKPPLAWNTVLLWVLPFVVALAALFGAYRALMRRSQSPADTTQTGELTDEEKQRLRAVLDQTNTTST